jgi:multiple sugar transport system substrate-binding protein
MKTFLKILLWSIIFGSTFWAFFLYSPKEPPKDKIVVTHSVWGGVAERKAWAELVADFERKHSNIKVDLQIVPLKYGEKMLTLLAADIAPDILYVSIPDMIPKNVVRPIDDFLANDPNFDTTKFVGNIWKISKAYGHLYDIGAAAGPIALFYNVKHFKEAGLKTPNEYAAEGKWNWETFLACCKKLVKRDENGRVVRWAYRIYADYILWTYISMNGARAFNREATEMYFDDPKLAEALQRVADLALVHEVAPPIAAEEQSGVASSWQEFKRGRVSMMHSGPWMVARFKGMEDEYDVAPPPFDNGGRSIIGVVGVTGIWVKSKHPHEAYQWQSYLWSEDARVIWSRLGFDIPMLKSLVEHKERWIDTTIVPKHFNVFYELAEDVLREPYSVIPLLPRKPGMLFGTDVWEPIRAGRKKAKEALAEAKAEIRQALMNPRGYR